MIQDFKSNTGCLEKIMYLSWKLYSHSTCFRDQSRKPRQLALNHQNSYSQLQNAVTFSKGQQIQFTGISITILPIRQYFQSSQTSPIKKKPLDFEFIVSKTFTLYYILGVKNEKWFILRWLTSYCRLLCPTELWR